MTITSASYLFDPRPNFPLLVAVKQYQDAATTSSDSDAYTLIFAHGNGFPKETWEPCIEDLFALLKQSKVKVRDVWCIEAPNHGEASLANEPVLDWSYRPIFRWEDYSRAIHCVIHGLGTGIDVDFSKRRLFGIGHSMGAVSLMLSTTLHPSPNWSGLILVEPMLWPRTPENRGIRDFLAGGAQKRRDTWASVDEARKLLLSKPQWQAWEARVFDLYMKYGLRPVDEKAPSGPVTLSTAKLNEAACFEDGNGTTRGYRHLPHLVTQVPTHMVYGAAESYIPEELREDILNTVSGGRDRLASVSLVENAGHLVTVTHPKELADTIHRALEVSFNSQQRTAGSLSATPVSKL